MSVALTSDEKLMLLFILVIVMVFVVYFELRVMRGRARKVRAASVKKDEAFNSILTCRSVMNVLERQGSDVSEARTLVSRARSMMDAGNHERAIELCELAREELTKARQPSREPEVAEEEYEGDRLESTARDILSIPTVDRHDDSYAGTRLEIEGGPNYLVAKFEINAAKDEVSNAQSRGRDVRAAEKLVKDAKAEFDSGNYSKALSLAVKARKAVSPEASEETIPLKAEPSERIKKADGPVHGVKVKCLSCGSHLDAEDLFCGECGTKRLVERKCLSCGRKASESDRFCRRCGAEIS